MTAADALSAGPLPVGARLLVEDDTSASLEAEGLSLSLRQDQDTGEWTCVRWRLRCDAIAHGETAEAALAALASEGAVPNGHRWIVELEPGVWLAPWAGDPGRTCCQGSAMVFRTEAAARRALSRARAWRPFLAALVSAL